MHPGDLAGGFSDLYMTWLLYCAGAATEFTPLLLSVLVRDVPDIRFRFRQKYWPSPDIAAG